MTKLPDLGKVTPEFFQEIIFPKLGKKDPSIIVKPQHGVDFGVIDLGDKVMVLSTDPFYIARDLGIERAAWFAVHIIASDVAVSGIAPRYLSIDLNLPPEMSEKELILMWNTVHEECEKLGISVVTGHTARYAGCNYPMVGGATMIGIDVKEKLIIPRARVGDHIVVSKGPAVEATGLFAAYFPSFIEEVHGPQFLKKAQDVYFQMSTVKDALTAAKTGGVTAMHDATECGVIGGLFEMAECAGVGMKINLNDIVLPEEIAGTCEVFDLNPYISISEGTLLATVSAEKSGDVVEALKREGIPSSIVGRVVPREEGMTYTIDGREYPLEHPRIDPFWGRFEEYLKK